MRAFALVALLVLVAGCTQAPPAPPADAPPEAAAGTCPAAVTEAPAERSGSGTVTLLTYTAFGLAPEDFAPFENATGWRVEIVTAGDAGEALARALVTKDRPVADALFGVDNTLIHRAKEHGLFEPYTSPNLGGVPERLQAPFCEDGEMLATPVDYGYVALNWDPAWFEAQNVTPPAALRDLASPTYAPLTVVENPQTSSPGLAFLLATVATFPEGSAYAYTDFWRDFAANGGKVAQDWDSAYGKDFTQGYDETGTHDRPIVVSYSTSPAYVPMNGWGDATTAVLDLPGAAWLQIESVGVLRHAPNAVGARALVDHMLTPAFQELAAFRQVMHPVVTAAEAPAAYATHAPEPEQPAAIDAATVEANRERWLAAWAEAVGQA